MAAIIAHEDVLQHIYAFLQSSGYQQTILALQAESGVAYNTIHVPLDAENTTARPLLTATSRRGGAVSKDAYPPATPGGLERAILDGGWDEVLHVYVDGLLLPAEVKNVLYEVIFEEMLTLHGLQPAARALLHHAPTFVQMKLLSPTRYARLERMLEEFDLVQWETWRQSGADTHTGHRALYSGVEDVQGKREEVLRLLRREIHFVYEPYDGALPAALLLATSDERGCAVVAARTHTAQKRERSLSSGDGGTVWTRHDHPANDVRTDPQRSTAYMAHEECDGRHTTPALAPSSMHASGVSAEKDGPPAAARPMHHRPTVPASSEEELLDYPIHAPRSIVSKLTSYVGEKVATCCRAPPPPPSPSTNAATTTSIVGEPSLLLVGRSDGVVDMVSARDLPGDTASDVYSVVHTAGVLAMSLDTVTASRTNEVSAWVAVGYRDGWVKIYNLHTHKLVRRFSPAHSMGITALLFAGDADDDQLSGHRSLLLSASFDTAVHVLDVLTGSVLSRVLDGHQGMYVHALCGLCASTPRARTTAAPRQRQRRTRSGQ